MRWSASAISVALSVTHAAAQSAIALPSDPACPAPRGITERVAAVESELGLRIDDGRIVTPAAIQSVMATRDNPTFGEHARQALAARLVGTDIVAPPADRAPDRWGRIAASVFAMTPTNDPPGDVGTMIVGAGFARVEPSILAPACLPVLLRTEAQARAVGRGLWADPAYAVLPADDPARFAGHFGALQIVEGRVSSIGDSGPRLYLNFGPRRGLDFAAIVAKTRQKIFDRAGLPLHGLLGRRVRVRGLLDDEPEPHIDVGGPGWIEVLDDP